MSSASVAILPNNKKINVCPEYNSPSPSMLCEVVWLGTSVYCLCYSLTPTSMKLPRPNRKPPSKVQLPPQEKCSSSPVRLPCPLSSGFG